MALKATIYKAAVNIADMDRHLPRRHADAGATPVRKRAAHDAALAGLDLAMRTNGWCSPKG